MCHRLEEIGESVVGFAAGFDPALLTPAQAGRVTEMCTRLESSLASVRSMAAARAAEGHGWKEQGFRSPGEHLARVAGVTPTAARRMLDTGRRLIEQPEIARAALSGELSAAQAEAVSEGVAADASQAGHLLEAARTGSLSELNDVVARTKAAAVDQEARRARRHQHRSLRRWQDRDGALLAQLYGHPEDGAAIWQALDPIRRRLIMLRHSGPGRSEPITAIEYDALMTLARVAGGGRGPELGLEELIELGLFPQLAGRSAVAPAAALAVAVAPSAAADDPTAPGPPGEPTPRRTKRLAGSPARVMVRVDLDALLRGVPVEGELCEIAGFGPVPVSVVEELIATANPFIVGLLTRGERIVGVYHHGRRRPSAHQRSALDFLYPTCAVAGCPAKAGLQYDHREDWARTRFTSADLLDRLCPHHHGLKTRENWSLVAGTGKRDFVAPGDPRHPGLPSRSRAAARAGPVGPWP